MSRTHKHNKVNQLLGNTNGHCHPEPATEVFGSPKKRLLSNSKSTKSTKAIAASTTSISLPHSPLNYLKLTINPHKSRQPSSDFHSIPYTFYSNSNSLDLQGKKSNVNKENHSNIDNLNFCTQKESISSTTDSQNYYQEHLFKTYQALKFVSRLPKIKKREVAQKKVRLERREGYEKKKTLIFDLDETLVHCVGDLIESADAVVGITLPTGEFLEVGFNIRPFTKECLKEACKYFEVIVFTASHQAYADAVLDYLDPYKELIHHRLYRDDCIMLDGVYIKDLRILSGRRLKNTVIVDNMAYSFASQLDNGIPIISWIDDPCDRELYNLMGYMKVLAESRDVREINREVFHIQSFCESYYEEHIKRC